MTMPTLPVAPKMSSARASIQKLSIIPTAASGRLPAPQDTIITVRYRRGSLKAAVTSEAAALPTPITASRKPNMLESPPS